jgi:hypothetical protein
VLPKNAPEGERSGSALGSAIRERVRGGGGGGGGAPPQSLYIYIYIYIIDCRTRYFCLFLGVGYKSTSLNF